ncbi:uncharacterized protein BXZ73DRAFT_43518, partial [Epithele typhae]|uniref:uncharacterized protein n=1 Tax=Epithele typhae TaxID=378194 RepID=UPI002007EA69
RMLDQDKRIAAVFVPPPAEPTWVASALHLTDKLRLQRDAQGSGCEANRRGSFVSLHSGLSMGGGSKVPGRLQKTAEQRRMEKELHDDPHFQRIAGYQSELMCSNFPGPWGYAYQIMEELLDHDKTAKLNFPGRSIYSGFTVNYGPKTATLPHLDSNNHPGTPCVITCLGCFDHRRGAHIVFPGLKVFVQFPPLCSVLLSSAGLLHGNTQVLGDGERFSITQYLSGGLVRYVEMGFRNVNEFETVAERICADAPPGVRWVEQVDRVSTPSSLVEDRKRMVRSLLPKSKWEFAKSK